MILQISVEFKEAYELLVSAWAAAFVKQQGSLDLSREWFNWCQAKLSPQNLVLIDEIRRMEQAVPIALLLSCPHAGAAEFGLNGLGPCPAKRHMRSSTLSTPTRSADRRKACARCAKYWQKVWECGTSSISAA